jgi:hypothetical protein
VGGSCRIRYGMEIARIETSMYGTCHWEELGVDGRVKLKYLHETDSLRLYSNSPEFCPRFIEMKQDPAVCP